MGQGCSSYSDTRPVNVWYSARTASRRSTKPATRAQTSGSIRTRSSGRTPTCSLSQSGSRVMSPTSDSAILSSTERMSMCSGVPS